MGLDIAVIDYTSIGRDDFLSRIVLKIRKVILPKLNVPPLGPVWCSGIRLNLAVNRDSAEYIDNAFTRTVPKRLKSPHLLNTRAPSLVIVHNFRELPFGDIPNRVVYSPIDSMNEFSK